MAAATRIYIIAPKGISDMKPRLVRATNAPRALRHVADDFIVEVASQDDLVSLIARGVPVEVVQMILGHSSPEVTRKVYAHVLRGQTSKQAERASKLVSRHRRRA